MAGASALNLETNLFNPAAISDDTKAFNQKLMDIMAGGPKWYEVGIISSLFTKVHFKRSRLSGLTGPRTQMMHGC